MSASRIIELHAAKSQASTILLELMFLLHDFGQSSRFLNLSDISLSALAACRCKNCKVMKFIVCFRSLRERQLNEVKSIVELFRDFILKHIQIVLQSLAVKNRQNFSSNSLIAIRTFILTFCLI